MKPSPESDLVLLIQLTLYQDMLYFHLNTLIEIYKSFYAGIFCCCWYLILSHFNYKVSKLKIFVITFSQHSVVHKKSVSSGENQGEKRFHDVYWA